jgi:hypothetical protein
LKSLFAHKPSWVYRLSLGIKKKPEKSFYRQFNHSNTETQRDDALTLTLTLTLTLCFKLFIAFLSVDFLSETCFRFDTSFALMQIFLKKTIIEMSSRNSLLQTINSEATLIENKSIHDLKEESAQMNPNVNQKEISRIDEKLSKRKAKQLRRALAASYKATELEQANQQSSGIVAEVDGLSRKNGTFEKTDAEEKLAEIKFERAEIIAEEKVDVVGADKLFKKEASNFKAEKAVQEMVGKVSAPEIQYAAVVPSDEEKVTHAEADKVINVVEKVKANHVVEKVKANHVVEKVKANHVVEKVKANHVVEKVKANHVVEKVKANHVVEEMGELQPAVIEINKPNSENGIEPQLKEVEACIPAKEENSRAPTVVSEVLAIPIAPLSASISSRSNKEEIKNDQNIFLSARPTRTVEEKATKCACLIL